MDKGAFGHEEEILLLDGAQFEVLSVLDEEYQCYEVPAVPEGHPLYKVKCVITNHKEDENGSIRIHFLEGNVF